MNSFDMGFRARVGMGNKGVENVSIERGDEKSTTRIQVENFGADQ